MNSISNITAQLVGIGLCPRRSDSKTSFLIPQPSRSQGFNHWGQVFDPSQKLSTSRSTPTVRRALFFIFLGKRDRHARELLATCPLVLLTRYTREAHSDSSSTTGSSSARQMGTPPGIPVVSVKYRPGVTGTITSSRPSYRIPLPPFPLREKNREQDMATQSAGPKKATNGAPTSLPL